MKNKIMTVANIFLSVLFVLVITIICLTNQVAERELIEENEALSSELDKAKEEALELKMNLLTSRGELNKAKEDLQSCSFRFEELDVLLYDYEKQIKALEEKVKELTPVEEVNPYAAINMTEEEHNLLRWIVALECKGEPEVGRKAVIEEIFNRVLRSDWQDTVEKVLTAKGQFATWQPLKEYWNGDRPTLWAYPDESETELIEYVLTHGRTILPEDYVFFATYKANGKDFIQIGNHYFSRG